jgi:ElaB/YqjD/DUF883 family membrane-anchored ribosome-binding protein
MTDHEINMMDDFSSNAEDATAAVRGEARDIFARTADRLRDKAEHAQGRMAKLADGAASAVESTGDYVREFDGRQMLSDVRSMAKRHPGASLVAAAAVGFLVARAMKRSDS